MGFIYLIENKINGKKYVGQTIQNDIKRRWNSHKNLKHKTVGKILLNAYKKYGTENFSYKIICICFDEDTNKYEKEYIKYNNTLYPNGYNLLEGGENKKHNEYTKQLLSNKMKGNNHPNFGKKLTNEHVLNIKKSRMNETPALEKIITGRCQKESTKLKIKEKIHMYVKEKSSFYIEQYDLNNTLLNTYYSYSSASKNANINKTYLIKVLNGQTFHNTAKGFIWKQIHKS